MKRNLLWKALFVLFVLAWSLWEIYPPTSRNLIDEFERRAIRTDEQFHAIAERARALDQEHPHRTYGNLLMAIGDQDITPYFELPPDRDPHPTRAILNQLQRDAAGSIRLGLDLQGGTEFLVALDTNRLAQLEDKDRAVSQAAEVLRSRVDRMGVAEPVIQPAGDNLISIQLPGLSEDAKESAKAQIESAAFLEFRLVHENSEERIAQGLGAPGHEVLYQIPRKRRDEAPTPPVPYLVERKPSMGLTGAYVSRARVDLDPMSNLPQIILVFDSRGDTIFADLTRRNVGRQLAIVLDGEIYSAPVIRSAITGGRASIEGDFTLTEAYQLANVLENPLETPVSILQEFSVEPSLGRDSIASGLRACIIGGILVSGFMLGYYLFAGVVANMALMLNLIILLGVMASIGATLTLPGIAGILLTIGMAVDANVLIFERIREELRAGKSLKGGIAAGYDKAFSTIFDANVTTLIASIILIFFGTGPVQGFGVTLTIGIAVSMFTALVVTRLVFDFLLEKNWLKSLNMYQMIKPTQIDFLHWAKPAFAASWVLVFIGLGYAFYRGQDILGVDFKGGDRTTFSFVQKLETGEIRNALGPLNIGDPLVQYQRDGAGYELLQVTTAFNTSEQVQATLASTFPEAGLQVAAAYNVGPTVGQQILRTAIVALLLAMFGILIYVALRFEFSFAIAAIVAVLHDVFMTMGWFALTGREFSAPMVAAILTIIGFSINDTIVIFDRIREDLKLGARGTFKDVINQALNKTLSRTLITSGTLLLAALALYIFGGPIINDFAFTFLVGIIVGTYSTIYIASAFILWWHKGERPKETTPVVLESEAATTARA
jgi:SecD/SecF fusion protein